MRKLPKPEGRGAELDFGFVRSTDLRNVLGRYYAEAKTASEKGLWTSAVILCGSVVEGMLVDAMARDENRAKERRVSLSRRGKFSDERFDRVEQVLPVSHWPFDVLIRVASSLQLLSDGTARHCEGLRYTRNLIHPVRAAKDVKEEVTKRKAETAQATVRECHEKLEKRLHGT